MDRHSWGGGCLCVHAKQPCAIKKADGKAATTKKGSRPRNLQGHMEKTGLVTQDR